MTAPLSKEERAVLHEFRVGCGCSPGLLRRANEKMAREIVRLRALAEHYGASLHATGTREPFPFGSTEGDEVGAL